MATKLSEKLEVVDIKDENKIDSIVTSEMEEELSNKKGEEYE